MSGERVEERGEEAVRPAKELCDISRQIETRHLSNSCKTTSRIVFFMTFIVDYTTIDLDFYLGIFFILVWHSSVDGKQEY